MKLLGLRITYFASLLGALASCTSCKEHTAHKTPAVHAKPGPEESFSYILDTFRRRIEETPVGFVMTDPSGRSTMTGTNKVSAHDVIKPAKDGDPYKATITVESQSNYSIRRTKDSGEDKAREKNAKADSLGNEADKQNGVESFDPSVAGGPPAAEPSKPAASSHGVDETVTRRPDVERRTYELLYKSGRWELVTELNKETEQSIQNAFKSALETQD